MMKKKEKQNKLKFIIFENNYFCLICEHDSSFIRL